MEKVKKWKLPLASKAPWWVRNNGLLEIELWKDSIWRIQGLSIYWKEVGLSLARWPPSYLLQVRKLFPTIVHFSICNRHVFSVLTRTETNSEWFSFSICNRHVFSVLTRTETNSEWFSFSIGNQSNPQAMKLSSSWSD
jgi:hypothetical protein